MTQIVASKPYCLENSTQLTRPPSEQFYRIDGSDAPTIIDKHQATRLYRLQRAPIRSTELRLDQAEVPHDAQGYFNSTLRKQVEESTPQATVSVYHKPTDMSDAAMKRFSLGKSRMDPPRMTPQNMNNIRTHPTAITILKHEQGPDGEVVPRFTDRLVVDRALRGRLGPGGTLNPEEDGRQAESYLRAHGRLGSAASSTVTYVPRAHSRTVNEELKRDELARHFMYTSTQQAAFDEVTWDSKLPPKLPVPLSTYEADGSDPVLKTEHAPALPDARSRTILDHDRTQTRQINFYRKPIENVAPLPRAQQISGYSGCIGGEQIQDIDNPAIPFKPFTVLRTDQPKFGANLFKPNIPFYTGNTHWTKTDPVSHYDREGRPYTTTAAFHKPLPLDQNTFNRHADLNGQLSRAVTTVVPQNPFNQMSNPVPTTNDSLDSRAQILVQQLARRNASTEKDKPATALAPIQA